MVKYPRKCSSKKAAVKTWGPFHRKSIGAVVATSLLIVVAVLSIVAYQSWFKSFSTETYSDVEKKSSSNIVSTGIETLVGSDLYFKNGLNENISIVSVYLGENDCNISGTYNNGINTISLENCTNNLTTSTPDVIVTTNKGSFIKRMYLKTIGVSGVQSGSGNLNFLYSASLDNTAKSFDSDGNVEWTYTATGGLRDIVVDQSGYSYAGGYDKILTKIDSSGNLVWQINDFNGANIMDIAIDDLGYIYTGDTNNLLRKFDSGGNNIWNYTASSIVNRLDVDSNGNIYINPLYSYRIDKISSDGQNLLCSFTPPVDFIDSLVVGPDDNVYFGGHDNKIWKINSTCGEIWQYSTSRSYGLAIDSSLNVYSTLYNGTFIKLDSSGNLIWSKDLGSTLTSLNMDTDENLYVGYNDGRIGKYEITNNNLWIFPIHSSSIYGISS